MALGDASGALDKIPGSSCPAVDQRGVVRPQGAACDIGAFEAIAPPPAPVPPAQPVQPINPVTPTTPTGVTKPVAKLTVATHYAHNHDGSIVISATVNGAGRIRVRDATPTGRHHKARVASLSKTVTKATTIKLTIKPSAAAKAALRHHRSVSVRLRVTFTPKGTSSASAASRTKTVSLQVTALRSKHH
jgi:hypothetical protein